MIFYSGISVESEASSLLHAHKPFAQILDTLCAIGLAEFFEALLRDPAAHFHCHLNMRI